MHRPSPRGTIAVGRVARNAGRGASRRPVTFSPEGDQQLPARWAQAVDIIAPKLPVPLLLRIEPPR